MKPRDPADVVGKTIIVRCPVDTAFRTWTERIDTWWPKGHSRSGDPRTTVTLEQRVGGRLYERTPTGVEHDWGAIIAWDPPHYLAYHWFLGSGVERPTRVDVRFMALEDGRTRVDVRHVGSELIGELWSRNRAIYQRAWEHVLPAFGAALSGGSNTQGEDSG